MPEHSHLPHGVASPDTLGYDTVASRRKLDTSGARLGGLSYPVLAGRPQATFVQPPFLPSGFSADVKLHTNKCNVEGLSYALADGSRWSG